MAPNPGAFRRQDTVVLTRPGPGAVPHPQFRWQVRAPADWEDYNIRAAWREGEPVDGVAGNTGEADSDAHARYHAPSGMVLLARWGILQTVVHERSLAAETRRRIRRMARG